MVFPNKVFWFTFSIFTLIIFPTSFLLPSKITEFIYLFLPNNLFWPIISFSTSTSTDLFIKGNLTTSGDIQIEGEVEGNIKASLLTVGQNAKIRGEINTNELIINGFVSGTIRSKKVTLTSSAKVEGDIIHNTIAIETGAHFEGSIEKTDNPLSKSDLKNGKLIN